MKCQKCRERKGKRSCPGLGGLICTQCCGEKRVIEIPCPPECRYLAEGQSYQTLKTYVAQLETEEDALRRNRFHRTTLAFAEVLNRIEAEIARFGAEVRALTDLDVLEVVQLLRKTYETEDRGLIFEHSSTNPLAQSLLRDLRRSLEEIRNKPQDNSPRLTAAALQDCCETIASTISFKMKDQPKARTYIHFAMRNHPEAASRAVAGRLLIP